MTVEGQLDLTDLVDDEHIAGSMPAGAQEVAVARAAYYRQLAALAHPRPRVNVPRSEQPTLDLDLGETS